MSTPILIHLILAGLLFQSDATEDILKQAIGLHQRGDVDGAIEAPQHDTY